MLKLSSGVCQGGRRVLIRSLLRHEARLSTDKNSANHGSPFTMWQVRVRSHTFSLETLLCQNVASLATLFTLYYIIARAFPICSGGTTHLANQAQWMDDYMAPLAHNWGGSRGSRARRGVLNVSLGACGKARKKVRKEEYRAKDRAPFVMASNIFNGLSSES